MKDMLIKRRDDLKAQYAKGQAQLAEAESRVQTLRETLLRISGAIQVIDETLAEADKPEPGDDAP